MDFSKVKLHCSSLGVLFMEPKSAEDKKKGELSGTAKTHLIKVYIKEYWGRERKWSNKYTDKGTQQEHIGIKLLSDVHGIEYAKNTHTLENDWIIGTPDIIHVPTLTIIDTKLSWDADTFLPNLSDKIDNMYYIQLQGYLYLSGMEHGKVSYCLVDATQKQILDEQKKLFYAMDVVTEESPEYLKACAEVERNMTYNDIPKTERIIDQCANRDEEIIKQIPIKVAKAREYLNDFHQKHISRNKASEYLIKV